MRTCAWPFDMRTAAAGPLRVVRHHVRAHAAEALGVRPAGAGRQGPSCAYSLPIHPVHTRRDRVASLPPCRLHGAAIQRASPLGPGRALTLPCGWNNAGCRLKSAAARTRSTGSALRTRALPSTRASPAPGGSAARGRAQRHGSTRRARALGGTRGGGRRPCRRVANRAARERTPPARTWPGRRARRSAGSGAAAR